MKTNEVSACSWKAPLSFEMLLGQFKICLLSKKAVLKIRKFIHFSDYTLAFQSIFYESAKKAEFQICFGAWNLNEEQTLIILQKNSPVLIHR